MTEMERSYESLLSSLVKNSVWVCKGERDRSVAGTQDVGGCCGEQMDTRNTRGSSKEQEVANTRTPGLVLKYCLGF